MVCSSGCGQPCSDDIACLAVHKRAYMVWQVWLVGELHLSPPALCLPTFPCTMCILLLIVFDVLQDRARRSLKETLNAIKCQDLGVYVQASTLGSLEALVEFLNQSKIPVR